MSDGMYKENEGTPLMDMSAQVAKDYDSRSVESGPDYRTWEEFAKPISYVPGSSNVTMQNGNGQDQDDKYIINYTCEVGPKCCINCCKCNIL